MLERIDDHLSELTYNRVDEMRVWLRPRRSLRDSFLIANLIAWEGYCWRKGMER